MSGENIFSKLWNSVKQITNDYVLNKKIENKFKDENKEFTIYTKESIFSYSVNGYFEGENLIIYGNYLDKKNGFIKSVIDKKIFRILKTKQIDLKIIYDNNEYIKQGTILYLDENIEEVEVIKVGEKYYKYNVKKEH